MTRIKTMYSKLKNWHKVAILVGFFVIVTVALLYMNQPSTKVTLFKNLSETSQTQVTDELGKIGVDYTIDKNGDILVDKSVEKLVRDKMEEDGIPYTGTDGNDILLNSSLGASEEDKKMQEQVGTKANLEKEILQSYSNVVDSATVQMTMPESDSIFEEASQKGSAAVTIKTKGQMSLSTAQVQGIQRTVSAAIPNINAEEVAVIDSKRGVVSDSATTAKDEGSSAYKNEVDIQDAIGKDIKTDIEDTLSSIFALKNFRVNTNVTVNFDEIKQKTEKYPRDGKVRSEQKDSTTDKSTGSAGQASGTESNADVPNYTENGGNSDSTYTSEKNSETTNYELDSTMQEIKKHPALAKTNVVVWVDQNTLDANRVDMNEFTKAVGVAAGLTPNMTDPNGDGGGNANANADGNGTNQEVFDGTFKNGEVTIMPITFLKDDTAAPTAKPAAKPASHAWVWWILGSTLLLLIAGGIVFYIIWLKRKEQIEEAIAEDYISPEEALVEKELSEQPDFQIDPDAMTEPSILTRRENLKEKISDLAKEDPGRAAAIIQKWLNERQA
ncbi:flagellar basal-body MS-ring/collar protein FliF [Listeria grayi]|uniref:Flagellar M-ring protein FliF n=2 Tax=Listeria grayi TaxID=1641 RepID=D7V0G3_LISGR|nr:flagellar basal-body MS-ring/collar protein FliF [Listeria grayi]EFI83056.1 flagellar M-ring protein FliF [Listeria grayi DSM 20601]